MGTKVSIGMPVYNAESFIAEAIESILSQTFTDFELIISDNASTDSTAAICETYVNKDSRVKYFRNNFNLGISRNYKAAYERSSPSPYFKWAAYDDVMDPTYLERCVSVLDSDPSIVCVHTFQKEIDENGKVAGLFEELHCSDSKSPNVRFNEVIHSLPNSIFVGDSVIRRSILDRTLLFRGYPRDDFALLAELALYGRLYVIPEYLFSRRFHKNRVCYTNVYHRILVEDPSKAGKLVLPAWCLWLDYFSACFRVPLSVKERFLCSIRALTSIGNKETLYLLKRDLKWAAVQVLKHRQERAVLRSTVKGKY
jgi:glycosyltransferase involved in cell wall biosynthesis